MVAFSLFLGSRSSVINLIEYFRKRLSSAHEFIDINQMRTNSQDPDYGMQKLIDIALKGLSPSVNDPSTAIEALHSITAILSEKIQRPLKDEVILDYRKKIIFKQRSLKDLIGTCYDQIIQFGKEHQAVIEQIRKDLIFIRRFAQTSDLNQFIDGKLKALASLQYAQSS